LTFLYKFFICFSNYLGYSGVGLMTKIKPIKVTYELDNKKHSNEGRVIIAEYDKFILVNSYIPNSARGLIR